MIKTRAKWVEEGEKPTRNFCNLLLFKLWSSKVRQMFIVIARQRENWKKKLFVGLEI